MPLRSLNEAPTVAQALTALGSVMVPNTQVAAANGSILVNSRALVLTAQAVWPALLLWEGDQSSSRIYWQMWQSKVTCMVLYANRFDQNATPETMDSIWAAVDTDLRRMKANLEDTPRVVLAGTAYVLDIAEVVLSPYLGDVNLTEYPIPIVERVMTVKINMPAYTSGG